MSAPKPTLLTPREYLEIERKAEVRSEYIGGRLYAMPGSNRLHNLIAGNILAALKTQLRGKQCETYAADMRVKIAPTGTYTYPDVITVCGEPRFEDPFVDTLLNPTLIVEVLSTSTEAYDRGEKFAQYRSLDSLREYMLVAQNKSRVEHYRREASAGCCRRSTFPASGCTSRRSDARSPWPISMRGSISKLMANGLKPLPPTPQPSPEAC